MSAHRRSWGGWGKGPALWLTSLSFPPDLSFLTYHRRVPAGGDSSSSFCTCGPATHFVSRPSLALGFAGDGGEVPRLCDLEKPTATVTILVPPKRLNRSVLSS